MCGLARCGGSDLFPPCTSVLITRWVVVITHANRGFQASLRDADPFFAGFRGLKPVETHGYFSAGRSATWRVRTRRVIRESANNIGKSFEVTARNGRSRRERVVGGTPTTAPGTGALPITLLV